MTSELIVKIQKIHELKVHPTADRLELAVIGQDGGWQTCVKKDVFHVGQEVVYIPPDTLVPKALHEMLGITNYCGELPVASQEAQDGFRRVRATSIRGQKSFGTLMTLSDLSNYFYNYAVRGEGIHLLPMYLPLGLDVANLLGVKKWTPRASSIMAGDAAKPCTWFHEYTKIRNIRDFSDQFQFGEEVIFTEKIHGTNCRVGLALDTDSENPTLTWMAGSHEVQRKEFAENGQRSRFWEPLDNLYMKEMITHIAKATESCFSAFKIILSVIVFCEIYGPGVQDMTYGVVGKTDFRVFDIAINGNYLNYDALVAYCNTQGIPIVPELYRGPFSLAKVEEYTDGPTTLVEPQALTCKFKGREGIVMRPIAERYSDRLNGRLILKSVSADYLGRKNAVDNG